MKLIKLREAAEPLAEYAKAAHREPHLVTDRGRPVLILVDVRGSDLESIALSTNPKFIAMLERSRRRLKAEGGIPIEEVMRRTGLSDPLPRGPAGADAARGTTPASTRRNSIESFSLDLKTLELMLATRPLSACWANYKGKPVVITSNGKPMVAMIDVRGRSLKDITISYDPAFLKTLEKPCNDGAGQGGITSDEMRRRLGIGPASRKVRASRAGTPSATRLKRAAKRKAS